MGENEGWSEPGGALPNGLLPGAGPVMQALNTDRWMKAEERTAELIACIQPNQLSEKRRNAVADYVQRLIMKCFPCQVCTFGSVPLKTYLPDGDIDLTTFSHNQDLKDSWANLVRDMLEDEEKNENAEFHVKEVQYIQAEVKLIKCLVENIVVDISFNQIGGLCTLCFLDEVDNLINQNHLFKRSIILIKAWCYYESRILGAHHGLISTYALETLVLYIFHVFNNTFSGPLEVLYRFLEFFSNFDWDNFCVSLWGPVSISSLPDVTAGPPRKDGRELLLSKLFLDACSSVYAVFPGGQENSEQPFVSKHLNIIDPLRINNNLGRSVSKGNFFRIRSAFAFGAKRLARLLVCPKENLIFEVNQFFMNTWERHGSGHRPDAPAISSWRLTLSDSDRSHEFGNSNNNSGVENVEESPYSRRVEAVGIRPRGVSNQHGNISSGKTSESNAASRTHNLKNQFNLNSSRITDQIGRDTVSDQVRPNDTIHQDLPSDHSANDTHGRLFFARTRSSPELTDKYIDTSSQVQLNRQAETADANATYSRPDSSSRKNLVSESLVSHNRRSSVEDISVKHVASQQSLGATDSSSISNNYHGDLGLDASSEEFSTSTGAQMMHQEEQDIVNMMASASLHGFNGQGHVPFNLTSGHFPYSVPPSFLASMGYTQRSLPGFVPANISLMDPSFSHLQFPPGLVSPQLTHYLPGTGLNPSEDPVERSNEIFFAPAGMTSGEAYKDFWLEHVARSSGGYDPENGSLDALESDDKPPASVSGSKYIPPPYRVRGSGNPTRGQQRHLRGKHGAVRGNTDTFSLQDFRSSEVYAEKKPASSRFSSGAYSNSLRSRTSSESSWDGASVKAPKSSKEKRGKKILSSGRGKGKVLSEQVYNDMDDDDQEWGLLLNVGTETIEGNPGSKSVAPLQVPGQQMPGFEVAQTSGSDSMIPFAPMLTGPSSRHGANDNSGLLAFYPTGPPIPFLTMLPVYNVPPEADNSDVTSGHFGGDEAVSNSESAINFNPKRFDQSEDLNSSSSLQEASTAETSEEQKSDILNSDFASHWQNLQFGRFCQNPRYQGPLLYPSPIMVPPNYVQGRLPYDNNPVRPLSTNTSLSSQVVTSYGNRLFPVSPLQPVSSRHPNIYQSYMDDMPRYRSGTGTYLPNHKVSTREGHSTGSRKGNYNHDRNDSYGDRGGNWNANSQSRAAPRNHSRSQTDKSNSRTDRFTHTEGRAERPWNSYIHNPFPSYQSQNIPLRSNPSQNDPPNVAYSMYPLAAMNPNGASNGPSVPPVMMLYPFDHNATFDSPNDQLEFGSLGPLSISGFNEQSQLDGTRARAFKDHRLNGNSGHRSSPDQPSSPHDQRRV